MKRFAFLFVIALALGSCRSAVSESPWASQDAWFQTGEAINDGYADVIYFVSTNIFQSRAADGSKNLRIELTDEEKAVLGMEIDYIHTNIFPDSLNYFSPFYHQMTLESFSAPADSLMPAMDATFAECQDAFDYYMENLNGGRPYILAGFSQGAMIVKSLLKNMTDKQFSQMVAAYVIGFELTEEDLKCPHIVPATGPDDTGVTVSFNSVCSVDCTWPLVCTNPVACINPVNWCTDATPAPLQAGDVSLSVAVDPDRQVVVVTGYGDNPPASPFPEPWPHGNLHGQEIIIYASSLGRNALERSGHIANK